MRCTVLVASAGLMIGAAAVAKPFNRNCAPTAAPWLVHVDVEAAMKSEIGKLGFEGPEPILAEVQNDIMEDLGFDLFAEVRSVTIYGLTAEQDNPVIIISTTPTAETKMGEVVGEMHVAGVEERGRMIYTMDAHGEEDSHVGAFIPGADASERILVIARDNPALHAAIDIVEGKGKLDANLDQSPLSRAPSVGSIVFVSASEIDRGLDIEPVSVVLQKAEGMRFDLGETGGQMYMEVDLRTTGEQEAVQIQQMIQGGLAMAQFVAANEPQFAEIAALTGGMNLTAEGRDVALRFRHDSKDLLERLNRLHQHAGHDDGQHEEPADGEIEVFRHKVKVGEDGKI